MAVLAQQTLHIVTTPTRAIVRGRLQPGRIEGPVGYGCMSYGGGCRGKFARRVLPLSSSFHELPLLQLQVLGGGHPVSKFTSSCGQLLTKLYWSGNSGVNAQSHQRRRASREDDNESSSEEETKDEQTKDEQTSLQTEESKTGFWRNIWEPGQKDEDNTLDPEEELLLQDLENLRFDWRALLDPTKENLIVLGFTALLTLGLFKIFSQLVVVVITILLSALKYTVVAAVLLGLLIFLI